MRFVSILVIAAWFAMSVTAPAEAAPIVAVIGALAAGLGTFGQALVGLALSFGMSALSSALAPKPDQPEQKPGGSYLDLVADGGVGREIAFGRCATAGHLVYFNTYGDEDDEDLPNRYLQLVFALSDWVCEDVLAVWVNGERCDLEAIDPREGSTADAEYGVEGYRPQTDNPLIRVRFFRGTFAQAADAELVEFADFVEGDTGPKRWTTDHRLAGVCYVSLTLDYRGNVDANGEANDDQYFPSGTPEFIWEMKGARQYDPRRDSTAGGSGSHRWNNPATWEYTNNPAICAYNYYRGFYRGNVRVLGMGVPSTDLLIDTFVSAANICEEEAPEGGNLYNCSVIASEDNEHRDAIQAFVDAMAGQVYERAGLFAIKAGAAEAIVATLTDADLAVGYDVDVSLKLPRSELGNWFGGVYTEPNKTWSENAFVPLHPEPWLAEDNGEKIEWSLNLRSVSDRKQALRVRKIRAEEARCQARANITVGFRHLKIETGDWIRWDTKGKVLRWRVEGRALNPDLTIKLQLREIAAGVYDGVDYDEPDITQIKPQRPNKLKAPKDLAVEAFTQTKTTAAGRKQRRPALRITYKPIKDKEVEAVIIRIRDAAEPTDVFKVIDGSPQDGKLVATQGIQKDATYEVRATLRCKPKRITEWTNWVSESTAATESYAPNADEADYALDVADLTITAAKIRDLEIETRHIKDAQIDTRVLKDLAVTAAKIQNLAIDASKIANLTIDAGKIQNLTIDASKIANLTINGTKIADEAISTPKIVRYAVSASRLTRIDRSNVYPDFDMTDPDFYAYVGPDPSKSLFVETGNARYGERFHQFNADAATQSLFSDIFAIESNTDYRFEHSHTAGTGCRSIVYVELFARDASGNLTTTRTPTMSDITFDGSDSKRTAAFTTTSTERKMRIVHARLGGGAGTCGTGGWVLRRRIDRSLVVDLSIDASKIDNLAIDSSKIANSAITAAKIVNSTITGDKIFNLTIDASKIQNLTIITDKIADLNITEGKIGGSQVTGGKIAPSAVTESKIATASIITAKMVDGAVSAIAAGVYPGFFSFDDVTFQIGAQATFVTDVSSPAMAEVFWIIDGGDPFYQTVIGSYRRVTFRCILQYSHGGVETALIDREFELPVVALTNDSPQREQHWGSFAVGNLFTTNSGGGHTVRFVIRANNLQGYNYLRHVFSVVKVTILKK